MYVQRVKDILTEEFINPFSVEMDKTKLYNITSVAYTSNDISEWLLTIFKRGKIQMVEFKERISKNAPNKYIFDPIKREKWKSFEDTVKRKTKIKIDGKIKDIAEQKNIFGLLAAKSDQIKLAVDIKNVLSFPLASVSLPLSSADGAMRKAKISNLYGAIDSLSNHNISLENYTGVNYLFADVAAAVRAVKNVPKTFEDIAIKLINDVSQRYNVVFLYVILTLKSPLKQQKETIEGVWIS